MAGAVSRSAFFKELFLLRVSDQSIPHAAIWLFLYTSPLTALFAAIFVGFAFHYAPELYSTVGTGAGQHNPRLFPSVIFNPLVESLVLAALIKMSVRLGVGKLAIVVAAVFVAAFHSLENLSWGLTVLSFFLIQAYAFFHAYKTDFWRGYLIISIAHALHNGCILVAHFFITQGH